MPDGDLLAKNQIQQQEQNTGAQRIDRRTLDETQAAQVFHFLEFELQNLFRDAVEPHYFLMREAQALHQFNIAQRLRCRARQRGRLGNNGLLHLLDPFAEHRTDNPEQWNCDQKRRRNRPMHPEGVDHHKNDADHRNKKHIDGSGNKPLYIAANFL